MNDVVFSLDLTMSAYGFSCFLLGIMLGLALRELSIWVVIWALRFAEACKRLIQRMRSA